MFKLTSERLLDLGNKSELGSFLARKFAANSMAHFNGQLSAAPEPPRQVASASHRARIVDGDGSKAL